MKVSHLCLVIAGALSVQAGCKKISGRAGSCYRGRLAVKGACANYTIQVTGGSIDPALVAAQWRDEQTGITHANVFGLGDACSFPATLNEGDSFYFTIAEKGNPRCMRCMAWYPTPDKKLFINVLPEPCQP